MIKGLQFLYSVTSVSKLREFLDKAKGLDLSELRDEKGNTVLHVAAFQNKLEVMKVLVQHVRKTCEAYYWGNSTDYKKPIKLQVQSLLNQGNLEGFTCLHYASYRGNVEMIRFLESLGANALIVNKSGLNLLHSAAQADKLSSMLYLHNRFDINATDIKNSTALHWASYGGSELVAQFLLAQQETQIDLLDSEHQTPLHVAIRNGRTRIVKKLLLKGADRELRNGRGQNAIEIARGLQFNKIEGILETDYSCLDHLKFYYNTKTRFSPQTRNSMKPLLFVLSYLFVTVPTHLLVVPVFDILYLYISSGINAFVLLLFLFLLIPPPTHTERDYKDLIDYPHVCCECKILKGPRTVHCYICKVCVSQYDHHCTWINGCVGKHNIKLFPTFLFLLLVIMMENAFFGIAWILKWSLIFQEYRFFGASQDIVHWLEIGYEVVLGSTLLVSGLFFFQILYLFCYQVGNLCLNLTTYQRMSKQNQPQPSVAGSVLDSGSQFTLLQEKEPNQASCRNCLIMCRPDQNPQSEQ